MGRDETVIRVSNFQEFQISSWVAKHCKDWQLVQTLYNEQEKIPSVLSEHTRNGKIFFEQTEKYSLKSSGDPLTSGINTLSSTRRTRGTDQE
jgi:hypothetical protein